MEVDNDILDGVVAIPYIPNPPPYVIPTPMPTRPRPVMQSQALTPSSLDTQSGTTSGSLSRLSLLNQTGAEDNPAAYLSFQAPNKLYVGYQSFSMPVDSQASAVSTMLLQVNFKGNDAAMQTWTWSVYDWKSQLWIRLGDSIGATADEWNSLLFKIPHPQRYISPWREVRIQLRSDNANGDAKMDYEALHITYISIPTMPSPVTPVSTPSRPGIFSVPVSTLSP